MEDQQELPEDTDATAGKITDGVNTKGELISGPVNARTAQRPDAMEARDVVAMGDGYWRILGPENASDLEDDPEDGEGDQVEVRAGPLYWFFANGVEVER